MDPDEIIKRMIDAQKRMQVRTPKKLPDGYICVIHPRHRHMLEQIDEATPYNNMVAPQFGIPIYEENRAPQDRFEFMDLMTYYSKYPPIFPKHYSRRYILWDNFSTMVRRWYIRFRYWLTKHRK